MSRRVATLNGPGTYAPFLAIVKRPFRLRARRRSGSLRIATSQSLNASNGANRSKPASTNPVRLLVLLHHRARPATEARRGRAAGGRIVLRRHDGTLATPGVAIKPDEAPMAAAPGRIVRRQKFPDVIRIEVHDRPEHEAALEIVVRVETSAGVVSRDHARARRALAAPHAQQKDHFSREARLLPDVPACRPNLHSVRAPTERAIGRRVAAADQIDPEGLVFIGRRGRNRDREFERGGGGFDLRQSFPYVADDQWAFHERVVRDDMNGSATLAARERKQMLDHEVRHERTVLAAREADDPRLAMRLPILLGDFPSNPVEHIPIHASRPVVGSTPLVTEPRSEAKHGTR